jgi:leader peptidase (prepilin peptidase)/N-methyltransferase
MVIWPLTLLIAIVGLSLGSFLNVVIHRLPRGMSLAVPRSHCPSCKKSIRFYDNIPLLSYTFLAGRCRNCGHSIPFRYPLVELVTAMLLAGLHLRYQLSISFVIYAALFLFLIPIIFIDIDHQIIPDKLTIPGFILGIALVLGFHFLSWKSVLAGAVITGPGLWLLGLAATALLKKDALGFGDVKLLMMGGVFMGFWGILLSLFLGAILAVFYLAGGAAMRRIDLHDRLPFGPFIALGIIVYVFLGDKIVYWYYWLTV